MSKTPKADKAKTPRKPPKPLEGTQKQQYESIVSDANDVLEAINQSTVPAMHIRKFKRDFTKQLTELLKSRKVDPKKRESEKLQAQLKKIQDKIAANK